jgi:PAS domain S-box-containing protein
VERKDNMESQNSIDAIFQYATEGILLTNEEGVILQINPSAERLFGYQSGELVGRKVEILIPKRFADTHHQHRANFERSPHPRSMGIGRQLYGAKKNGTEFPVEISLSPYAVEKKKFVVAFVLDITQRKIVEEKLKNYSIDLEQQVGNRTLILQEAITELEKTKNELHLALEKEKELNELKTRFVSMASHEFRTPLTTILSSLSLVKTYGDQNNHEKQHKHIHKIKSSITNLTDLLNDFLSVSQLEEGKIGSLKEVFLLQDFIQTTMAETEILFKKQQKVQYCHTGENNVFFDKKILKSILLNLLSNAAKFSFADSIVHVKTENTGTNLILTIEDQGIGISESDQKHLFQRFFRARNASTIQGTGLGLNIIENYVGIMKGSIQCESTENIGTKFTLIFPAK